MKILISDPNGMAFPVVGCNTASGHVGSTQIHLKILLR